MNSTIEKKMSLTNDYERITMRISLEFSDCKSDTKLRALTVYDIPIVLFPRRKLN